MRIALVAGVLALTLASWPRTAEAKPAMPRPLERKVEDADLVVIARLLTKPAHPGEEFDVSVEEVLKGKTSERRLRVKAAWFYMGCVPMPEGTPLPKSIEQQGEREILFLDAPEDGARQSHDPIVIAADHRASSWWPDVSSPSVLAPEAIRELVRLDAEEDTAKAVDLWERGFASENPLVVACALRRVEITARDVSYWKSEAADGILGKRLAEKARRELAAGRSRLLAAVARYAASDDAGFQGLALETMMLLFPPASDAERPTFDAVAASAREASKSLAPELRERARWCLAFSGDAGLVDAVVAALRWKPTTEEEVRTAGFAARECVRRHPEVGEKVLAAIVGLLDDNAARPNAIDALVRITDERITTAEGWRAWWRKRSR